MQVVFKDDELENFYNLKPNKLRFSASVQKQFILKVNLLKWASDLRAVYALAGSLRFEKLSEKKYKGKYSIRVNDQRRVIIDLQRDTEITLLLEEITDYH
jgi:plasmid maintenance system killer protein